MRWMVFLIALAACSTPGLKMRGAKVSRVEVGVSTFDVYVLGDKARAVRVNFETGRRARGIMARGFQAIELGSGCQIVPGTYDGDPALMQAQIFCRGAG